MTIQITSKAMLDMVRDLLNGQGHLESFETNRVDLSKVPFNYNEGTLEVDENFAQALREGVYECVREDIMQGECVSAEMWRLISLMSELMYMIYAEMERIDESSIICRR